MFCSLVKHNRLLGATDEGRTSAPGQRPQDSFPRTTAPGHLPLGQTPPGHTTPLNRITVQMLRLRRRFSCRDRCPWGRCQGGHLSGADVRPPLANSNPNADLDLWRRLLSALNYCVVTQKNQVVTGHFVQKLECKQTEGRTWPIAVHFPVTRSVNIPTLSASTDLSCNNTNLACPDQLESSRRF